VTACSATVIQIRERLSHWRSVVVDSSGCALLKWRLDGIIQITTYSTVLTLFLRTPLGTADVTVVARAPPRRIHSDRSHRNVPISPGDRQPVLRRAVRSFGFGNDCHTGEVHTGEAQSSTRRAALIKRKMSRDYPSHHIHCIARYVHSLLQRAQGDDILRQHRPGPNRDERVARVKRRIMSHEERVQRAESLSPHRDCRE
jgi:hypothetical protein